MGLQLQSSRSVPSPGDPEGAKVWVWDRLTEPNNLATGNIWCGRVMVAAATLLSSDACVVELPQYGSDGPNNLL